MNKQIRRRLGRWRGEAAGACLVAAVFFGAGCQSRPVNPSFAVTSQEAEADIQRMREDHVPLTRPVVALAGWADPWFASAYWNGAMRKVGVPKSQRLGLTFAGRYSFDACREHVIEAVQAAWPSDDPDTTVEVDVVAFSMGGLIARYAAAEPELSDDGEPKRRLKIARLFTISTPHRGASLASLTVPFLTLDPRLLDMRPDSDFIATLNERFDGQAYELYPYTRTGDWVVDEANTAPPGMTAWWVANPPLNRPHQEAYRDPRIEADILRRLRNEEPLTTTPAAALPD